MRRWTIYVDSQDRYPPVILGATEGPEDADAMARRLADNMRPVEVVPIEDANRLGAALQQAAEDLDGLVRHLETLHRQAQAQAGAASAVKALNAYRAASSGPTEESE